MLTLFFFLGFTASKSSCVPLLIIIPLDMYSACTSPGKLIAFFLRLEDELSLVAWCARVPSTSNIADGPSRGSLDDVPVKFLSAVKVPYSSQFDTFLGHAEAGLLVFEALTEACPRYEDKARLTETRI